MAINKHQQVMWSGNVDKKEMALIQVMEHLSNRTWISLAKSFFTISDIGHFQF
jgi:hypothetical protein